MTGAHRHALAEFLFEPKLKQARGRQRLDGTYVIERVAEIFFEPRAVDLIAVYVECQPLGSPQLFEIGVDEDFKATEVSGDVLPAAGATPRASLSGPPSRLVAMDCSGRPSFSSASAGVAPIASARNIAEQHAASLIVKTLKRTPLQGALRPDWSHVTTLLSRL
ncbi:hypothetical protein T281_01480 [Rhodomicrobium udaipurense JA643]|nr:hypothetical protein T281_01480 [Rhodomicrobium udaipurense JA643]